MPDSMTKPELHVLLAGPRGFCAGVARSIMVQRGRDLDLAVLEGVRTVGVTAGASAPEVLVEEVLNRLREGYNLRTEEVVVAEEKIIFKLPAALTQPAA